MTVQHSSHPPATHPVAFKIKTDGTFAIVAHAPEDISVTPGDIAAHARGGHVWPRPFFKQMTFRVLRRLFGNRGWIAAWTRTWRGPWIVIRADNGQRLPGAFATHGDAVRAEVTWLLEVL
ncbi:MAG: hypothetical protein JXA21_24095 [Anaerolineae bacterium]|nr:hypothetical protein [Anaerolineae bacterium]